MEPLTVVTHLLAATGTLAAVGLLLVMAVVPFLLDLPLPPTRAVTQNAVWPAYR